MVNYNIENILRNCVKIETELLLFEYYKKEGYNIFKSSEMAQDNLAQFVDSCNYDINNCRNTNIPSLYSNVTNNILNVNRDYFTIIKIKEILINLRWEQFEDLSAAFIGIMFGGENVKVTARTK